ncbi:hypothetical protein FRC04_010199 [Tulasnella sp. 424]|nr:hypothetical protein FRC04_010199 [Tulasnella sp. 424]KAG8966429.1 hypothetical protein FRC05_002675 [Tulasnella sp. 425]
MSDKYVLFHSDGAGSTFPLVLLRVFKVPHEVVNMNYEDTTKRKDSPELRRLLEANPLAQFPTLLTPEGGVMTETAAIALYLNDRHGLDSPWSTSRLAAAQLAAFYRFLVYIPANIYPTVTIVEFPERYISVPKDANVTLDEVKQWVSDESSKRRADAWTLLETQLGPGVKGFNGSFLLGTDQPTMLDVYVTMMAHWTPYPRYDWFKKNCPRLYEVAHETMKASVVARQVFEENGLDAFMGRDSHAKKLDSIP